RGVVAVRGVDDLVRIRRAVADHERAVEHGVNLKLAALRALADLERYAIVRLRGPRRLLSRGARLVLLDRSERLGVVVRADDLGDVRAAVLRGGLHRRDQLPKLGAQPGADVVVTEASLRLRLI